MKWPTGWCHQRSEGSWSFPLQFAVHLVIHRGSPSSPSPLGCWTSMGIRVYKGFCPINSASQNSLLPFTRAPSLCLSVSTDILHKNSKLLKTGTLKMRDMNLRDMKMRHHVAGVENARHEFAAPTCKGGNCESWKCEKRDSMEHQVLHVSVHCRAWMYE